MKKIGSIGGRIAIALSGLLLLFAACEKDVLPRGSGRKVAIKFVIGGTGDAVRGFNTLEMKPKTTVVHLRDNLYMYAKLVPDEVEDGVKAATTSLLVEGQHVHMEAYYVSDGTSAGSADYHANAAGNLVLDNPNLPLEVDPALGPFHFTAYSYYKSTDPISETGIDPTVSDLIWGEATNQTIDETESGRTVTMVLEHCFSRVRVKINVAGILNTTITNVGTISIGGKKADLDVSDGSLTTTAVAVTQTVSDWEDVNGNALSSPFSEEVIVSGYAVVYPSPTVVTIGSITLDIDGDVRTISRSASFTEALTPGQHYTLVIDMKPLIWAQSNIYWESTLNGGTGGLTFQKPGDTPAHKDYQGVFFRWGSLIGMDPRHLTYDYYVTPNPVEERILFIPPVKGEASWVVQAVKDSPWSQTISLPSWPATYSSEENNDHYPYYHPNFTSYFGDICSYLSNGEWRMPGGEEFGGVESFGTLTYNASAGSSGSWDGKSLCGARGVWSASGTVFFPASGSIRTQGSWFADRGCYWTGYRVPPYNYQSEALGLDLYPDNRLEMAQDYAAYALSVRCVKTN